MSASGRYPALRNSSTRDRAVALRELLAVGAAHVRHVRVDGDLRADRPDDVDLLRRVRDVVLAADDVRDPVPDVLHRRGEVVGRPAVGADEHEVLDRLVRDLDAVADDVVPARRPLVRHPEPDRALVLVRLAVGHELVGDAPAVVHPVELEGVRPVPVEAEPAERVLDLVDRLRDLARGVGVLDPQPELPALVAREEPVEERGADVADVEEPGRAGSHADADGHGGSVGRVRGRTLTLADLNRATLARQLLLQRRRLSPLGAIERLVGMQAQWPPAPYVGLWSRLTGFRRATLERAILRGDVLKPTVMRGTLHLVTARDYPTFWAAFRDMPTWFGAGAPRTRAANRPGGARTRAQRPAHPEGGTRAPGARARARRSIRAARIPCTPSARAPLARARDGALDHSAPGHLRRLRRAAAGRHACGTDRDRPPLPRALSARRHAPTSLTGPACASPTSCRRSRRSNRCGASATKTAASCSTFPALRYRLRRRLRRCASCRSGTTSCSHSPTGGA